MCRNIKKLRRPEGPPTREELDNASLQFVRKISGFNKPSRKNEEAFHTAVAEVSRASAKLFEGLAEISGALTHSNGGSSLPPE